MEGEAPAMAPEMGEARRLVGIFFPPGEAYQSIVERPRWWVPLVLLSVLTVAFIFAFTQRVGWERFMRQQMESNPRIQEVSAEQREQILQQQLRFVPIFGYIQSALAWLVIALVAAGAFLFVFNVLVGTEMAFRQVLGVTCYALVPHALGAVLAFVVLFLKDPEEFDLTSPVASNLGALLDPSANPGWLVSLGSSIDLFSLWTLFLLATGFSVAARKLSWSKSFTWVMVTWIVWLGVKTLWAWIFS